MLFLRPTISSGLLALVALSPQLAKADCECGYRVTIPSNGTNTTLTEPDSSISQQYILTDLLETNFANISDVSKNTDWIRQAFNKTAEQSAGTYGEMMAVDNIESVLGTGLEITLRGESDLVEGMVQGGEIDSARTDMLYGTFRSSMKLTGVSGTVSAFFFYFNDSQEIDMEFLSREFITDNATYPVNLVLQSQASEAAGSASHTSTFQVINLSFDPRADFHEYRFDWVPGGVVFLADGAVLAEMNQTGGVPTHAGHLALNHWSNGNAGWSGGPPASDAVMEVRYLKAYFNSSDTARQSAFAERCVDSAAAGAVCDIPDVTAGNDTAAGWFFTGQKNMTANQTVSSDSGITGGDTSGGIGREQEIAWLAMGLTSVVAALVLQL
ncbi:hypothetical protein N0V82_008448 [Gnomoniopsis sp. IMI 355080]|nr:hypothetical protein N0V82_008448 [Gnomoniopsis sp. IMI 355080]